MALSSTVDEDAPVGVDASKVDIAELGELAVIVDGETQVIVGTKTRLVLALFVAQAARGGHRRSPARHRVAATRAAEQRTAVALQRDPSAPPGSRSRLDPHGGQHLPLGAGYPFTPQQDPGIAGHDPGDARRRTCRIAPLSSPSQRFEPGRGEPWSGLDDVDPVLADRVVLEASRLEIEGLAASAAAALGEWTATRDGAAATVAVRPYQESWWCSAAEAREQLGDRVEALLAGTGPGRSLDQAGVLPALGLVALEQRLLGEGGRPTGTP